MAAEPSTVPAHLTREKPPPGLCYLAWQFAANELRESGRRIQAAITGRRPPPVRTSDYAAPDSRACREAMALAQQASPGFLFGHCLRTHAFAVAMAHRVRSPVDREVLFLGCIMHDLGLTPAHDRGGTFELDGARSARALCVREGIEAERADLVHEMVALHNSVGIAHRREPEVALVHYGAGADVIGLWVHDIDPGALAEILEMHPRTGFREGMARLIEDQVRRKPDSYMASMCRLGFLRKIRATRLPGDPS